MWLWQQENLVLQQTGYRLWKYNTTRMRVLESQQKQTRREQYIKSQPQIFSKYEILIDRIKAVNTFFDCNH